MSQPLLTPLPSAEELQTVPVYQALNDAGRMLAELKGGVTSLPNPGILLDTLSLQEALASSAIEQIVTTEDEAFHAVAHPEDALSGPAKEVALYSQAVHLGYRRLQENNGISVNSLVEMYQLLKQAGDGLRKTPVSLKNPVTGVVVYTPPERHDDIVRYMTDLEQFINHLEHLTLDPLIQMALIHHRFESIHPFRDGNGRIGRILNILYLVHVKRLETPILYLSRAINATKSDYYRLLQTVRSEGRWEEWVIYMLGAVRDSAESVLEIVKDIRDLMAECKRNLRGKLPKLYSQDLLNNLFRHPYTRIEFIERDLSVGRLTASKYLKTLAEHGFVKETKRGRNNYYINDRLVRRLMEVSADDVITAEE